MERCRGPLGLLDFAPALTYHSTSWRGGTWVVKFESASARALIPLRCRCTRTRVVVDGHMVAGLTVMETAEPTVNPQTDEHGVMYEIHAVDLF